MSNKKILEYALKGIMSDIRELENKIHTGHKLLCKKREAYSSVKKSFEEIKDIIHKLELEKRELSNKYDALNWELSLLG